MRLPASDDGASDDSDTKLVAILAIGVPLVTAAVLLRRRRLQRADKADLARTSVTLLDKPPGGATA